MNQNCTIYIARHGETEFNAQHLIQGHVDSPLTEKGIAQAKDLSQLLKDVHFDAVYSSDLLRAQRTAEIVTLERNLVLNTTALLRERNYGSYEGKPSKDFKELSIRMLEKLKHLSKEERRKAKFADDIESDEEVCTRLILFLREVSAAYPGKTILVISHGGIMRAFLNHLAWSGEKELQSGAIGNTAFIKLLSDGVSFTVTDTLGISI